MAYVFDASKPIAMGADHAGVEYKQVIKEWLEKKGYQVKDFGTYNTDSVDYPDFAHPTAASVETGEAAFGILFCGSANGVAITANKHAGVRAGLCWLPEIAQLTRLHNDANMICVPARFVSIESATEMIDAFMTTAFEGGRHQGRVDKITCS
ncbi:MAG: ribose 5-phosphate isomerase B [Sediminibacterium sp.]|nr:ribose 5-phosphate isomerase B [Sediminibacterium sp.]MBP6145444.1 ribose 5-phosphate isomerase B [Sediminibacterium sp.]MBP7939856.1 ribose 5-phosphate isomerase B [Sediminibacterium sp.]